MENSKIIAKNKKARQDYFMQSTYETGSVQKGTEKKQLRENHIS